MKAGSASTTAELVAMGRALANGSSDVARFSDPTAMTLISDEARSRVERIRNGVEPHGIGETTMQAYLVRQAQFMVARTVAIDDAVREAASPQLVILGAGYDGRAWRMPELSDVDVFEVDHPDSQKVKRERVTSLQQLARSIHFVPVDFTKDSLDRALAAAGHDSTKPTTWIWEGVVMYLTPEEVDATLAQITARSANGSRLIVVYHAPAWFLRIVGLLLRRVGEPLRSRFRPAAMAALLAKRGFHLVRDDDMPAIGRSLSPTVAAATKGMKHMRIAIASRR